MALRLRDVAKGCGGGVKDLFMLDPNIIQEKPGWNVRTPGPDLDAHIRWLADSIKAVGVQEAVTVYLENDVPILTNGHCRLLAVKLAISEGAEIRAIPARAEERYANDADRVLGMITRNGGKPLTPMEQAEVVKRLLAFGWEVGEIATKTGFSRTHINNLEKLAAAPAAVAEMVKGGQVSARTAVKVMREKGAEAPAVLAGAVKTAGEAGKRRASAKHFEKPGAEETPVVGEVKSTAMFDMDQIRDLIGQHRVVHEDSRGTSDKGPDYENGFIDAHDAILGMFIQVNLINNEVEGSHDEQR